MRKCFIICIMAFTVCSISAQTRIAILPFSAGENVVKSDMSYLTEEFTLEMVSSDKYIVLERVELKKAMKELQLQNSDEFDETQAAEVGKLAGAEQVFFGSVYLMAGQYNVSVRCVDIRTGAITFAKKGISSNEKTLVAVCKKMALQIVSGDTSSSTVKIELTAKERKVKEYYLDWKQGISATNKQDMSMLFKRNLACGITLASIGATHLLAGIIVTCVMCSPIFPYERHVSSSYYNGIEYVDDSYYTTEYTQSALFVIIGCAVGVQLLVSSAIITPLCALPFAKAKHIKSIYEKSTGEKLLAFIQRTSFGGSYDWVHKEVTAAMAIRL